MKLSISPGNRKTGRIPSVSLPPGITCTAEARKSCFRQGCYAVKLQRIYPNVRAAWENNLLVWKSDPAGYMRQIADYIRKGKPKYFRWHISGDIPSRAYLDMIIRLALEFPGTRFLAFTKHIDYAQQYYRKDRDDCPILPSNFNLVFSCWPGNDAPENGIPCAYLSSDPMLPQDARHCPGNCEMCGMCWSLRQGESVCFDKH